VDLLILSKDLPASNIKLRNKKREAKGYYALPVGDSFQIYTISYVSDYEAKTAEISIQFDPFKMDQRQEVGS
jgi:hypothetical protein